MEVFEQKSNKVWLMFQKDHADFLKNRLEQGKKWHQEGQEEIETVHVRNDTDIFWGGIWQG